MALIGNLQEIAKALAIDSKASGIEDFGCLRDDDWDLTEEQWNAVCEEAERLRPIIKVPAARRAAWSAASLAFSDEEASERRSVLGGGF